MNESYPLRLGRVVGTGRMLAMSEEQRRTHIHIIGASGKGKSSFIEHLMRQDIIEGRGLCLIDPHGELSRNMLDWVCRLPSPIQNFHYIAPHRNDWTVCYNPFRKTREDQDNWFLVNAMKLAAVKVWGADNTLDTPRLDEWLGNVFFTAVALNMTLPEVGMLLEPIIEHNAMRRAIASRLPESAVRISNSWNELCYIVEKKPMELDGRVGSTLRRLNKFLDNPRLSRIYGIPDVSLDLVSAMDTGGVIIADLSPKGNLHPEDARFLGTIMLTDFYVQMFGRKHPERLFSVYIDEFQKFAVRDMADMLDESRKFGLGFVLAHQRPGQLSNSENAADRDLYSAVMTNGQTKAVFGGITPAELEPIARHLSIGTLDPNKIKLEIRNPVVVGYTKEYWQARSEGTSQARTRGAGGSSGTGAAAGGGMVHGQSVAHDPNTGLFAPSTLYTGESSSWQQHYGKSDFSGESWMDAESDTESQSLTTFPTLVPKLEERVSSVYYDRIEDQLFVFMAVLHDQKQRQAMIRVVGEEAPVPIMTPFVKPPSATQAAIDRQLALMFSPKNCFLRIEEADLIVAKRKAELKKLGMLDSETAEPKRMRSSAPPRGKMEGSPFISDSMRKLIQSGPRIGGVELQERDLTFLAELFDCRFVTIRQAAALYFDANQKVAMQRLKKLLEARIISKEPLPVSWRDGSKVKYSFQKETLDILIEHGLLPRYSSKDWDSKLRKRFDVSESTIKHELAVIDVKAALQPAINALARFRVIEFGVWPLGYEFNYSHNGKSIRLQPDGYLCIAEHVSVNEREFHHFYLEVDRGTEDLATLLDKAIGYRWHYKKGGFRDWLGRTEDPPEKHPFRVLVVTLTAQRRDNICDKYAELGIATQIWFTTFDELMEDPLGAVWTFPKLFRETGGGDGIRKVSLLDDPSSPSDPSGPPAGVV